MRALLYGFSILTFFLLLFKFAQILTNALEHVSVFVTTFAQTQSDRIDVNVDLATGSCTMESVEVRQVDSN